MVGLEQPKPNARGVGVRRSLAAVSQGSASHAEAGSPDLYRSRVVHLNSNIIGIYPKQNYYLDYEEFVKNSKKMR